MKSFLLVSFIFLSTTIVAQLDSNKGTKEKGKIKAIVVTNSKEAEKPKSIELDGINGFKQAFDRENEKLKKKQEEDKFNNKGILTQEKLNEQRFLKSF